jgi:1-acyl-sn-glycerol-3-phosphate acyltransferase
MAQVISLPTARGEDRCQATTAAGKRCRNRAIDATGFCRVHQKEAVERASVALEERSGGLFDSESFREALELIRRRSNGQYEVDEFGFDPELTEKILMPIARPLYEKWWRVDWVGMDNVPDEGSALLVSNHAGTVPWDALVMKFGILDVHPAHRHVRLLAADLAFKMPFIGPLARKSGNTLANTADTFRLLEAGELLGVFPEGYKGVGKAFKDRYRLQRFGRGGFIEVALRTKTPIIPVSIVGSEEIHPMIYNLRPLARAGGFPYFPITPTFPLLGPLGLIPLPSKWIVEFGEPISTEDFPDDAWQDSMLVFNLTDQVRDVIQQTLYKNLMARRSTFF